MSRYSQELNDLLALNNVYISAENIQNAMERLSIVTPAQSSSIKNELADLQKTVDAVFKRLENDYDRAVTDFCFTVETYIIQSEDLLSFIFGLNAQIDSPDSFTILNHPDFIAKKRAAQETGSYLSKAFEEVYVTRLQHAEQTQKSINMIQILLNTVQIFIMTLALGLCLFFFRRIVIGISRSITQLLAFTHDFSEDPMISHRLSIQTGDEIELFAQSFNQMLDQIQNQITMLEENACIKEKLAATEMENLRILCEQKNNELNFLQSQINYHFLFNTLNMVVQTAILEEAPDTARLLTTTSELLRYNLGKFGQTVSIADELKNVRNYMTLQQTRFGSRLHIEINAQDSCMTHQIPRMILQPLIENAITHGIGSKVQGGHIWVRIFQNETLCCFEIEDDGIGIPADRLEQIRCQCLEKNKTGSSIGIKNVYKRLCIFYQQDIDFHITSCPGKTLIHAELPYFPADPTVLQ